MQQETAALPAVLDGVRTSDAMFCLDSSQRVVRWSEAAEALLGYPAAEVVGKQCYDILGGRDAQNGRFCRRDCPVVSNARRGRTTADYDIVTTTKRGADVWVNVSVLVLKGERARTPYVMHLLRDVTERRRVETLARTAMEALRRISPEARAEDVPDSRPTPPPALSRRETEVLRLLALGMSTAQIAHHLGISPVTARNHVTHVVSKLGARSRLQAVVYASRRRLI